MLIERRNYRVNHKGYDNGIDNQENKDDDKAGNDNDGSVLM